MKLFLRYLKSKKWFIVLLSIFVCIFVMVFALYHVQLRIVIYPSILCMITLAIFFAFDFARVYKKHKVLEKFYLMTEQTMDILPSPDSISEEDYKEIIRFLRQEEIDIKASEELRYRNMIEYYTIWAHQIKNPIAAMRLTLQNEDTSISRQLLSDLFRIEQYVEMVLTYIRLDSSSSDYVFKEYDLDSVLKPAIRKYSNEFILRKITLTYKPVNMRAVTDEKWLSFVLEQLISNALKYTKEGSISIYAQDNRYLCIEDTGIGIEPGDLPRIFERGYTGYNGRRDKNASGIGLYLCKRICDNLSIGISASSCVGVGTTIKLDMSQYQVKSD